MQMLPIPPDIKQDPIVSVLARLYSKNQGWMGVICGATGSGKSYLAIELCCLIDPDFDEDHIVFESHDFFKLLNDPKIQRGSAILYDELGKGAMAREFFTTENKELGKVLQTFRRMNVSVLFTLPSLDMADKIPRKLIHSYIETTEIDYKNRISIFKWLNLQVNPRFSKVYNKFPVVCATKQHYLKLSRASKVLLKQYEMKKKIYEEGVRATAQMKTTDGYVSKSFMRPMKSKTRALDLAKLTLEKILKDHADMKKFPGVYWAIANYDISTSTAQMLPALWEKHNSSNIVVMTKNNK